MSRVPIMAEGTAVCLRCGNIGVKDTFYGKGKQYCSANCVRGLPPAQSSNKTGPLFKIVPLKPNRTTPKSSNSNSVVTCKLNGVFPKLRNFGHVIFCLSVKAKGNN